PNGPSPWGDSDRIRQRRPLTEQDKSGVVRYPRKWFFRHALKRIIWRLPGRPSLPHPAPRFGVVPITRPDVSKSVVERVSVGMLRAAVGRAMEDFTRWDIGPQRPVDG